MKEVIIEKAVKTPMVVQSNRLIEARYRLSLGEQRLILAMISMIGRDDTDFKDYVIRLADFWKFLGTSNKNHYSEAKKITKRLLQRVLEIKTETGGLLQCNWISSAEYIPGKGIVKLCFDPKLKPYLLLLKEEFTRYGLTIIRFKSVYSIRMYGLLKQYEAIGKRRIGVNELRAILGIREDEYKSYKDLKRRVLCTAQKELGKEADVRFDFDEIKKGRKVVDIDFSVEKQPYQESFAFDYSGVETQEPETEDSQEAQELIESLSEYGVSKEDIIRVIETHGVNGVQEIRKKVLKDVKRREKGKNPVQDVGAYLATCLRQGYGKKTFQERQKEKTEQRKQVALRHEEQLRARLEEINTAVGRARKERFMKLKAELSPDEEERLKGEFAAAVDEGKHGESIKNAFRSRGWKAPGVDPLFSLHLKNRLLPSEIEDCRALAATKGEDYDALLGELKSIGV
jgi:plasmid replication initiation protein